MKQEQTPRPEIGIGFQAGSLTVEAPTGERKNGYIIWKCRCKCGGEVFLDTRCLQRGTVTDCGCKSRVRPGQRDITGKRFGKLTALYPTGARGRGGTLVWRCQCDCGGKIDVPLSQLSNGYRKSCGCLRQPPLSDCVGHSFGKLRVMEYAGKQEGAHCFRCRCACGKETVVRYSCLLSGHTKSCGCLQKTIFRENLKLVDGTSVTLLEAGKKHLISSNTSGHTGVYRQQKSGKWAAQITFKSKTYYLGAYDRIEDAVRARKLGEEMHEDFLEWYRENYLPQGLNPPTVPPPGSCSPRHGTSEILSTPEYILP